MHPTTIKNEMKRRRHIAYVLMAVCMVMLTATIIPHHHHFNFICLLHDQVPCEQSCSCCSEKGCCDMTHHHSLPDQCKDGCVTKFYCSVPPSGMDVLPYFPLVTILYSMADILKLGMPDESVNEFFPYIESLHSLTVQRTDGLRAPPCA